MTLAAGSPAPRGAVESCQLTLPGPAGDIEALIDQARQAGAADTAVETIAVVCHPHPQHHGTMHNKVVHTIARAFARCGTPAIRFNYRGVGKSAGGYAGGEGETEDARAVIDWAMDKYPRAALDLAGFSFGGMVAIRAAADRRARSLLTVAPAIRLLGSAFRLPACPWLLVQGETDDVVSAAEVRRWAADLDTPPSLSVVPGVGHYFHGALGELSAITDAFLQSLHTDAKAKVSSC